MCVRRSRVGIGYGYLPQSRFGHGRLWVKGPPDDSLETPLRRHCFQYYLLLEGTPRCDS